MKKVNERRHSRATFQFHSGVDAQEMADGIKFGTLPSDLYPIKLTVREYRVVEFALPKFDE